MKQSLSSLRFFFSFLVFIGHLGLTKVSVGHAFFIILSGFILMYVYENRIISNRITKTEFFIKRLIRVYPLHLITLMVSVFFVLNEINESFLFFISKFIVNLFLLQAFIPYNEVYFSFNGVSWNVSVLLFCYFLFPFIVPLLARITLRKFTYFIISSIMVIFILMLFVPLKFHHALFYISPFFRLLDFIFGIYLFKLSHFCFNRKFNYNLLEVVSIFLFFAFYILANLFPDYLLPFGYSIYFWIPLGVLILVFNYEKGFVSNYVLKRPFFLFLGVLSYPFYMLHQLYIRFFERNDLGLNKTEKLALLFSICFVLTILTSYLYIIFEKKFLKRYLDKIKGICLNFK